MRVTKLTSPQMPILGLNRELAKSTTLKRLNTKRFNQCKRRVRRVQYALLLWADKLARDLDITHYKPPTNRLCLTTLSRKLRRSPKVTTNWRAKIFRSLI